MPLTAAHCVLHVLFPPCTLLTIVDEQYHGNRMSGSGSPPLKEENRFPLPSVNEQPAGAAGESGWVRVRSHLRWIVEHGTKPYHELVAVPTFI